MNEGPPPYSSTQATGNAFALPQKPGAPMQAVYVAGNPGYPPNQTGYNMNTTTTRTIVQQQPPAVIYNPGLGYRDVPVSIKCPMCRVQIITATEFEPGALSWLACCGLTAVG